MRGKTLHRSACKTLIQSKAKHSCANARAMYVTDSHKFIPEISTAVNTVHIVSLWIPRTTPPPSFLPPPPASPHPAATVSFQWIKGHAPLNPFSLQKYNIHLLLTENFTDFFLFPSSSVIALFVFSLYGNCREEMECLNFSNENRSKHFSLIILCYF